MDIDEHLQSPTTARSPGSASTSAHANSPIAWIAGLALIGAIGALQMATRALEQTGDSISYAWAAREGSFLFHPHHLVFSAAVRAVYLMIGWATGFWDILIAGQLHNVCFAALGLFAVFWLGWRYLGSPLVGLLGALFLASTNGFQIFATQIEVYVPALSCLILATAFLFTEKQTPWSLVLVATSWSLGTLYHQTGVLFAVPLLALFLVRRGGPAWRRAIGTTLLAGGATLAAYIFAYLNTPHSLGATKGFLEFCLWYAHEGSSDWGSTAHLSLRGMEQLLSSQWRALSSVPSVRIGTALVAGAVLVLFAALFTPARFTRQKTLLRFALVWLSSYGLFFWWWLPVEVEFCILMSAPLALAAMAAVDILLGLLNENKLLRWRSGSLITVSLLLLTSFVYNLRAEVLPRHRQRGESYELAAMFDDLDADDCLVMTRHQYMTTYRFYFAPEQARSFEIVRAFHLITGKDEVPGWLDQQRASCLIVTSSDLLPRANYTGSNGIKTPEAWLRFALWLFDTRSCGTTTGEVCARDFQWQVHPDGKTFLVVGDPETLTRYADPQAFFAHVADTVEPHEAWLARQLRQWLEQNRQLLASWQP